MPPKYIREPSGPSVLGNDDTAENAILRTKNNVAIAASIAGKAVHFEQTGLKIASAPNIAVDRGKTNDILVSAVWTQPKRRESSLSRIVILCEFDSIYLGSPFVSISPANGYDNRRRREFA